MKTNHPNGALPAKNQNAFLSLKPDSALLPELETRFDLYPENKRRPVNKTLFNNEYFQLTYNMKAGTMSVSSRGDIVYSAIPYDTARNYIQRAAIQYLLHPEAVRQYIEAHKPNLENYLALSIYQVSGKRVEKDSFEVLQAYNAILQNPLLEIQVLGRLLQHDETGPLSANLAGKFLFSENVKTGISEYVAEYLNFVVQVTNYLPIITDGQQVRLLTANQHERLLEQETTQFLTIASDITPALGLLPQTIKQNIANSLVIANQTLPTSTKPLLRSEYGKELSAVRKNYVAHSVDPRELEQYFENVLPTENVNSINVVSDLHTTDEQLLFTNKYFNILAGDILDAQLSKDMKGLYVIGNHDLVSILPSPDAETSQWDKWQPFVRYEWFKLLVEKPVESWAKLPIGDHAFYAVVKGELEQRFPSLHLLHNSSVIHNGVRYIGLTIPVALVRRKKKQQTFILRTLKDLLDDDYQIPTVIVSHAPLFNELSMLSSNSTAYNKNYTCAEPEIETLFEQYNILGAIHGHHHIPASSGRYKLVEFAGKELFVVCSIYSKMNTGFELMELLDPK